MVVSDSDSTMADIVRRQARERPDNVALVFQGKETAYGELDRRASQVANGLIGENLAPQARVAVLAKNDDSFFEIYFGCTKSNTVAVPVNWRLAPPEIAYVINDSQAEVLFVGRDYLEMVQALLPDMPRVRRIVALGGEPPRDWPLYEAWRERQDGSDPELPVAGDDVTVQMYTSGTTGRPKGAQLTHANFMGLLPGATLEWGGWTDEDVSIVAMPLFHIAGNGWGFVGLYAGAKNIIMPEVDPAAILKAIEEYRVTRAFFVPAVILFLLQTPSCRSTDFSSLKFIAYGASPIPLELLRQAVQVFGCDFAQLYGLTETTGAVTYLPPEDHHPAAGERMRSCGRPVEGCEIRVVDAEGRPCAPGEVGEIVCRSTQVMKGYWNLPEADAAAIRDGWFHSGDAGYFDADGYLYIYDRVKDMIVSGGENVYPAEVESALFEHQAVADVAVIGVPDPTWGEAVKAIVVKAPDSQVTADELIAYARGKIAGYKVPKSVDFAEALPRNPSGKILKRELRAPYWTGRERQVH